MIEDKDCWRFADPEDRWVFNKLEVATRMGYEAAPAGVPVTKSGYYVVRPIMNLYGFGYGAEIKHLTEFDEIESGFFWQEKFEGEHLSVDYHRGRATLCAKGIKEGDSLNKFLEWNRISVINAPEIPAILRRISEKYKTINCEFIDGKLIEVHLRPNPDFIGVGEEVTKVIPIWDEVFETKEGYKLRYNPETVYGSKGNVTRYGYFYR